MVVQIYVEPKLNAGSYVCLDILIAAYNKGACISDAPS